MTKYNPLKYIFPLLLLLALAACGGANEPQPTQDVSLVYTQAAQTVESQFTQTAAALPSATPSPTEAPTMTVVVAATFTNISPLGTQQPGLTPAVLGTSTVSLFPALPTNTGIPCNDSAFVTDVGVPDGAKVKTNQVFQKGWVIQNTGYCDWGMGYSLVRVGGNTSFKASTWMVNSPADIILAGQLGEITLTFVAPQTPNTYEAHFQMYSNQGYPFGTLLTVSVVVTR